MKMNNKILENLLGVNEHMDICEPDCCDVHDDNMIMKEKENHKSRFQCALGALKKYQPYALKKLENNPYSIVEGGYGHNIERISSYYSEGIKIYTWQKKWKGDVYIFGNPFPSYTF
jgi:hypothetical protein